jgi:hypothetical protein
MQLEYIKHNAHEWYRKTAQFFFFQSVVLYILACVTAGRAVGLVQYIAFLNHCCTWFTK